MGGGPGETWRLNDIWFEGNTTTVEPRGQRALDALAATLVSNRGILQVEVEVYVADGPDPQGLADRRAHAVVDELIARKVEPARLQASGRTERPANPNRPVVVLILKRAP